MTASALTAKVNAGISWDNEQSLNISAVSYQGNVSLGRSLTDGTGLDQCHAIWADQRTIANGATDSLDLTAMPSQAVFTGTLSTAFANVRAILIINQASATALKLQLDGTVANAYAISAGGKIDIGPDSQMLVANKKDGFGAVAGGNKIIAVKNPSAAPITYQIVILGN